MIDNTQEVLQGQGNILFKFLKMKSSSNKHANTLDLLVKGSST